MCGICNPWQPNHKMLKNINKGVQGDRIIFLLMNLCRFDSFAAICFRTREANAVVLAASQVSFALIVVITISFTYTTGTFLGATVFQQFVSLLWINGEVGHGWGKTVGVSQSYVNWTLRLFEILFEYKTVDALATKICKNIPGVLGSSQQSAWWVKSVPLVMQLLTPQTRSPAHSSLVSQSPSPNPQGTSELQHSTS